MPRVMDRFVDRELPLAVESLAKRFAFDVRHHVIEKTVGFARIEQRKDVRMIQPRRELDLAQKTLGAE